MTPTAVTKMGKSFWQELLSRPVKEGFDRDEEESISSRSNWDEYDAARVFKTIRVVTSKFKF